MTTAGSPFGAAALARKVRWDVTFGRLNPQHLCHDGVNDGGATDIRSLILHEASTCTPRCTVLDAAQAMSKAGIGSLAVIEAGLLAGIVTERDVVDAVASGADVAQASVDDWMTRNPDILDPDVSVEAASDWLLATGYRHLPVVEEGRLLGIVSIKDVLWALEGDREADV